MSEVITVEAVSDKFKNKYSSGSVKVGDKWMQVSSKLDINAFQKGSQIAVETRTNDKGYTSITAIADSDAFVKEEVEQVKATSKAKKTSKPVEQLATINSATASSTSKTFTGTLSYDDAKNKKILVQGLTQAALSSAALAGLQYSTVEEIAENAKKLALEMIAFVAEQSK